MKKANFTKELEIMRSIKNAQRHGESNFSSMDGDDSYYGEDDYDGMDYDSLDYDNATGPKGAGVIKTPQRTLSITASNQTGNTVNNTPAQDVVVSFFRANVNTLPSGTVNTALGILNNAPLLNALIDGFRFEGNGALSGNDIVITGDPAGYRQLLAESQVNPYQVIGLKLFSASAIQLRTSFRTIDVDLLGRRTEAPYTPQDKISAYQFQGTIIEDTQFRLSYNGNAGFDYTLLSPANAGLATTVPNSIQFTMYLYAIAENDRVLKGKGMVVKAPNKRVSFGQQTIKMVR